LSMILNSNENKENNLAFLNNFFAAHIESDALQAHDMFQIKNMSLQDDDYCYEYIDDYKIAYPKWAQFAFNFDLVCISNFYKSFLFMFCAVCNPSLCPCFINDEPANFADLLVFKQLKNKLNDDEEVRSHLFELNNLVLSLINIFKVKYIHVITDYIWFHKNDHFFNVVKLFTQPQYHEQDNIILTSNKNLLCCLHDQFIDWYLQGYIHDTDQAYSSSNNIAFNTKFNNFFQAVQITNKLAPIQQPSSHRIETNNIKQLFLYFYYSYNQLNSNVQ
jgi:hypothetical protein